MKNIIWKDGDNKITVMVVHDSVDSLLEAERLKDEGTIPDDWEVVLVDQELPNVKSKLLKLSEDGLKVEVDSSQQLAEDKEKKIAQCKTYLNKTDWEHTAFLERGRPYDEVKIKRLQAVEAQDLIKACTTLDELNQINTDF